MSNQERFGGEWETKRLGDLLSYKRPDTYIVKSDKYTEHGNTPVLTANKGFVLGYTDEDFGICQNTPVIVFDDFTTDNKYATFPFKVKSSAIKLLYPKHERVSLRFIFERMQLIDFPLGNHKRYYISEYQNLELPMPDYEEQNAIAEVLSDVDGLIASLDALIAKKRAIKQATMQQLLTGKTRLPGFSGDWTLGILADCGVFKSGNGFPIEYQGHQSGDYPFFKVSDLSGKGNQLFMKRANHYISENIRKKLGTIRFEPNSIAFAKIGAAIFLERKRMLSQESCLDNNLMAFTLIHDLACPKFFYYLFQRIELGKLVSTTALPALSGRQIGAVSISIPPFEEQGAIATVLSDMDAEISELEQRRDKSIAIKQGMMQQLLTGKVRLLKSE